MKKITALAIISIFLFDQLSAQVIKVQPFLQDASPTSIFILWETDSNDESIVEWGLTSALGNSTNGIAYQTNGTSRVHEVQLEGLGSFTQYFYRVITGTAVSDTYDFKTPPHAAEHESFRIVAMSDMQKDNSQPNKFQEIVEDGIIDYFESEFGGNIIDNLALVMIPGDLVTTGNNYSSWEETFFTPAQELFKNIPVYPVLGNHEANTIYYFQYFKMPENGTLGFEEHWWYKDYGNTRIIGLNSNAPFSNQEQLDWLEDLLDETCPSDSIDFVFAQLHHPHKSELWTPGESNYTGEVIDLLEQFTTNCSKPSIHFFGHTHGYSRGRSRDHKHLWINVATAGGAIDNWGEFPNFDYDEFSVSQDDYGFVMLEISDDNDPKVVVKRISRGDQDVILDNELTDSLTIRSSPSIVNTPEAIFPVNETVIPECVVLEGNDFSSPTFLALHGESHWQVSTDQNDFSDLAAESWKNFENWYFEEDTQLGDDLRDEKILGLNENTDYWWRVRYRDRELNWSDWSSPVTFTTGVSMTPPNLLLNPGAEDILVNWTIVEGVVEALTDGICNGISPFSGDRYFAVGGLCEHSEVGRCIQNVDVSSYADSIDTGNFPSNFGGYLSNFSGSDLPEMRLIFLDQNAAQLGTSTTISSLSSSWTLFSEFQMIPPHTRTIQVELKGTRNVGTDNDSYFDDVFLSVGSNGIDCDGPLSINNQAFSEIRNLKVFPNPVHTYASIQLPEPNNTNYKLRIVDARGSKIEVLTNYGSDQLTIDTRNLATGTYFFSVRDQRKIIGVGKFIVM